MAESKAELKSLLVKLKQEHEKVGWKLNIQKTTIMASGAIISWQIDGETIDAVARVQPRLIQGIWRRDGIGEGQETTA